MEERREGREGSTGEVEREGEKKEIKKREYGH